MKDDELDAKYLDPATNPMISTSEDRPMPDPKDAAPDPYLHPATNPLLGGQTRTTGIEVQDRINRLYPEEDLVDLEDGRRLMRMADRKTWQLDGKPLKDLDPKDLADLADLAKRL